MQMHANFHLNNNRFNFDFAFDFPSMVDQAISIFFTGSLGVVALGSSTFNTPES